MPDVLAVLRDDHDAQRCSAVEIASSATWSPGLRARWPPRRFCRSARTRLWRRTQSSRNVVRLREAVLGLINRGGRTSGADLGRRRERRPRVGFGRKRLRLNAANAFDVPSSFFSPRRSTFLYNKREVGVEKTQPSSCGGHVSTRALFFFSTPIHLFI